MATDQLDPLVVLQSFIEPHERTNPYSVQLLASFPPDVHAECFTWGRALRGRYDVLHVHWPEVKVRGATAPRSVVRATLFLLVLVRVRLGRRGLVRTLHDATPHEPPTTLQRWIIDLSERWADVWVVLNNSTPTPHPAPTFVAPLGHSLDLVEPADAAPRRGRLLHFGLIRRYKGVESLVRAVRDCPDPELELRIIGAVQDDDLRHELRLAAHGDPRITAIDDYVPDDRLRSEIAESELVVLPFTRITNSSSLLLALSLGRPVLAPAAPSIVEVADEVGPGWVHTYDGDLRTEHIAAALAAHRTAPPAAPPDLNRRDWLQIGQVHADAYREARSIARCRYRRRGRTSSANA